MELKSELKEEKLKRIEQDQDILLLKKQISELETRIPRNRAPSDYANNQLNIENSGQTAIKAATLPSSCGDLLGYSQIKGLDGIFLVKNSQTNKIEAVYCQFSTNNQCKILIL